MLPRRDSEQQRKRDELFQIYGRYSSTSEFWKQVPATNYLDGVKTAIQLDHARDDNVVSIEYSRNLVNILNDKNIANELKEYPEGGHNISGNNYNDAMKNTVDFFKKYL